MTGDRHQTVRTERLIWIAAFVVLVLGYYCIVAKYERRIAASTLRSQEYYGRMLVNQRLVADGSKVRRLRAELHSRLSGVLLDTAMPEVTAVLIKDIDSLAGSNRSTLISIVPQRSMNGVSPAVAAAASAPLHGLQNAAVDIMVRGRFVEILRVIAQLPKLHTLLRVSSVQFSLAGGQTGAAKRPLLDAKIRVLVYRYAGSLTKEDT